MTEVFRMNCAEGRGPELKRFEDIVFPNLDIIDPERGLRYAKELEYKGGDILLCSYPKSGTHWIGNILWKLKMLDTSERPQDTVLEYGPPEAIALQGEPRVIATHLKPRRLPPAHIENNGKIILLLRNPKDAAVSYYYHLKNAVLTCSGQTWDEFFHSYIQGEITMGSYFTYVREWDQFLKDISEGKGKAQLEIFYYEDMLANPKDGIARLNRFLGFDRDEEYLTNVLKDTTIGSLRDHYNSNSQKMVNPFCSDASGSTVIFRQGKVGDWKNHFTVAQSETMDKMLEEAVKYGMLKLKFE